MFQYILLIIIRATLEQYKLQVHGEKLFMFYLIDGDTHAKEYKQVETIIF